MKHQTAELSYIAGRKILQPNNNKCRSAYLRGGVDEVQAISGTADRIFFIDKRSLLPVDRYGLRSEVPLDVMLERWSVGQGQEQSRISMDLEFQGSFAFRGRSRIPDCCLRSSDHRKSHMFITCFDSLPTRPTMEARCCRAEQGYRRLTSLNHGSLVSTPEGLTKSHGQKRTLPETWSMARTKVPRLEESWSH